MHAMVFVVQSAVRQNNSAPLSKTSSTSNIYCNKPLFPLSFFGRLLPISLLYPFRLLSFDSLKILYSLAKCASSSPNKIDATAQRPRVREVNCRLGVILIHLFPPAFDSFSDPLNWTLAVFLRWLSDTTLNAAAQGGAIADKTFSHRAASASFPSVTGGEVEDPLPVTGAPQNHQTV